MRLINGRTAEEYGGKLSRPSKMDVAGWSIPATRCRIGSALARQEGTTCSGCYALKGNFRRGAVKRIMEENYRKLMDPRAHWTQAMAALIRWTGEDRFRIFVSGDLQGENHLLNLIQIAEAVPGTKIWMPTREIATVQAVQRQLIWEGLEWPENLVARISGTMIDGPPPKRFRFTSTVVSEETPDTCPSSVKGGSCEDNGCTRCWTQEGDIPYLKH